MRIINPSHAMNRVTLEMVKALFIWGGLLILAALLEAVGRWLG